jgi:hypothetical protein
MAAHMAALRVADTPRNGNPGAPPVVLRHACIRSASKRLPTPAASS